MLPISRLDEILVEGVEWKSSVPGIVQAMHVCPKAQGINPGQTHLPMCVYPGGLPVSFCCPPLKLPTGSLFHSLLNIKTGEETPAWMLQIREVKIQKERSSMFIPHLDRSSWMMLRAVMLLQTHSSARSNQDVTSHGSFSFADITVRIQSS